MYRLIGVIIDLLTVVATNTFSLESATIKCFEIFKPMCNSTALLRYLANLKFVSLYGSKIEGNTV